MEQARSKIEFYNYEVKLWGISQIHQSDGKGYWAHTGGTSNTEVNFVF